MSVELAVPKLAVSMQEGELVEWLAEDGSTVSEGQPIYSIEADKSTMEVEAPAAGTLRHLGTAGETYSVGTVIGRIE